MSLYPVTISSPIPPPPQLFSNAATLFSQYSPDLVGLSLFRNGILQTLGYDYTFSHNSVITFVAGSQPIPGDTLTADIFTLQTTIDGANPAYGTDQVKRRAAAPIQVSNLYVQPSITGAMDGVNLVFGLVFGPTIFGDIDGINAVFTTGGVNFQRARVYRNGILMTLNLDCSCSGDTIVFMPGQIPVPGDYILLMGWL